MLRSFITALLLFSSMATLANAPLVCYTCETLDDFRKAGAAQIYHDYQNLSRGRLGTIMVLSNALFEWDVVTPDGDNISVYNPHNEKSYEVELEMPNYGQGTAGGIQLPFPDLSAGAVIITSELGQDAAPSGPGVLYRHKVIKSWTVIDREGDRRNKDPKDSQSDKSSVSKDSGVYVGSLGPFYPIFSPIFINGYPYWGDVFLFDDFWVPSYVWGSGKNE